MALPSVNDVTSFAKSTFKDRFGGADVGKSQMSKEMPSFFTANSKFDSKSIQKNFRFLVDFDNNFDKELKKNDIKFFPFHVLSVDLPTSYGFKAEPIKIGPYSYSFPTMEHNGFDVTMVLEEDKDSNIAKLIHYLQYKIIKDTGKEGNLANGNYFPQTQNRISNITINIYDDVGVIVRTLEYMDMFFVNATPTSLNYDGNESVKYTVIFHGDFMQQTFHR